MASHTTSIGIRKTDHGSVHTYECWDCDGVGYVTGLEGTHECDRCEGRKVVDLDDCDCPICIQIFGDLEGHGHA